MNLQPVPLRQLLEEVIQLVCVEVDLNPKVQFMSHIDPDVPETLISDYRRLK